MAAKLTGLTHKTAMKLHLVAESCTICSCRSRRPVRILLDTPSYIHKRVYPKVSELSRNELNNKKSRDTQSVYLWATGWTIGVLGFDSRRGLGIFLSTTASRTALGTRDSFPRVKRPGREADHSYPSSAEVKECVELYLHSPNTPSWRGA
jgi:hypothetical protein